MAAQRTTIILSIAWILFSFPLMAQEAVVRGSVIDSKTKEGMIQASVVNQNSIGTITDLSGNYELKLPAGNHTLKFTFLGYRDVSRSITLTEGQILTLNIALEEKSVELGITVVSASKFEKKLSEETVTVEVISSSLIQSANAYNMEEALEKVPGVSIVEGQANIRGGSGWSYGAGSRVAVLVDDMPLLSADAADAKWSVVPSENIQQVEVIKGAASALYGSSALNGVINLRTAWAKTKPETEITIYGGMSQNPRLQNLSDSVSDAPWWVNNQPAKFGTNFVHRRRIGQFDLVASGAAETEKSHLLGGEDIQLRATVKTRYRMKRVEGLTFGLNINAYQSLGSTFFIWNGLDSLAYVPLPNSASNYRSIRILIDPNIQYVDNKGNNLVLRSRYFNARNRNDTGQGSVPILWFGEAQYNRSFSDIGLNIVTGLTGSYNDVSSEGEEALIGNYTGHNGAFYAQFDKKFFQKLSLAFGARYELFRIDTKKGNSGPLFRFGANYQIAEATYLRGSIGQGYRFPTIAEAFVNTSVGGIGIYPNPRLEPEKGWSAELGIKQGVKLGDWLGYVDLAGFVNSYINMMEFTFGRFGTSPDASLFGLGFGSQNIGNVRILGGEITAIGEGKLAGKFPLSLLAGYTYISPKNLNWDDPLELYNELGEPVEAPVGATRDDLTTYAGTSSSERNILKYRYRHTLKVDAQLSVKDFDFGLSCQYTSFMENIDYLFVSDFIIFFQQALNTQAFSALRTFREENERGNTLLDARVAYRISDQIKLSAIVRNILNQQIPLRPALLQPPRNFTVQLQVKF